MPRLPTILGCSVCLILLTTGCGDGSDSSPVPPVTAEVEAPAPAPEPCVLPPEDIPVESTAAGIEYVRTPDPCFESLPNYPYAPNYADIEGMRMHYIDEGPRDGEVVLMLHGQPSWSYLYRKMVPVLVEAGYRVIAADHIGMGRSDKPVDPRVHVYEQQVAWNKAFITELDLSNITLFVQDWGSLIGLRVAGDMPELFARIVLANGNLPVIPPGVNPFTVPVFEFESSLPEAEEFFMNRSSDPVEGFQEWINYAASASQLFAGDVVQLLSQQELTDEEQAAYNAPFPDPLYWGAIRAFPSMLAGIESQNAPALAALSRFDRPFLALAGEFDPNLGSEATQNRWINLVPGARGQDHRRYPAAHFIQEDVGAEMAGQVAEFMQSNPIPKAGPLYGVRYCEILLASLPNGVLEVEVYNTLGLNNCPQDQWDALNSDAVAEEFMALAALKNGPRFWLLDAISVAGDGSEEPIPGFGDIATFGEIEMRLAAIVEPSGGLNGAATPYSENEVVRDTIFTFVAGRRIYELEDPDGERYVMQSMSQSMDSNLQIHDLVYLDERLDLPPGWTYQTRILEEDLQLDSGGLARVIPDDFSNVYQKVE